MQKTMSLEKANAMLKKGAIAVIALFLVSNIYSIITYDNIINAVIESVSLTGEIATALRESRKLLIINAAAPRADYLIIYVAFAVLCFRAARDNKKIMPAFIFSIFSFIYGFRSVPNRLISSPYHPMMTKIFSLVEIALLGLMVYTTWTINKANKVLCKNCGKEMSTGAIFCANCGWSRIGIIIPKKLNLKILSSLKKIIKFALAILVTVVIVLVIYNVPKPKGKVYELGDIKKVKLVTKYWKNSLVENFDTVKFGSYYQSDSTSKEPIEWIVLDRQSDKTLILSKYILDCKCYSNEKGATWETCTLRNWLNNDFYHEAFSSSEQNRIQITNVINNSNSEYNALAGNNTNDKIFCLSIEEAEKYFNKSSRIKANKMIATKGTYYARNVEVRLNNGNLYKPLVPTLEDRWYFGNSLFWLRDANNGISELGNDAYELGFDGNITAAYIFKDGYSGVRPALWISY